MSLFNDEIRQHITQEFETLQQPVKLIVFTQEIECQYCQETRELSQELASLSDKISLEIFDFVKDQHAVETFGIDKIPALVVMEGGDQPKDYGIRYYGIPSGYEFSTLLQGIRMISSGDSGLTPESRKQVAALQKPLHLQVFVTPTCPYCPRAVFLAHQLAFESELVRADRAEQRAASPPASGKPGKL